MHWVLFSQPCCSIGNQAFLYFCLFVFILCRVSVALTLKYDQRAKDTFFFFFLMFFVYSFLAFSVFMFALLQKRAINMLYKRTDGYNPACLHPITLFLNMYCPFPQPSLPHLRIQSTSWHLQKCKMLNPRAVSKRRVHSTGLSPIPIKAGPGYLTFAVVSKLHTFVTPVEV